MAESQEQPTGWHRAKDILKGTYVTGEVAAHTLNPLAGPVAQQAHLEPVANQQAIVRQMDQEEVKHGAEWDHLRREEEAGRIERQDRSRHQHHQHHQPNRDANRDRQRNP